MSDGDGVDHRCEPPGHVGGRFIAQLLGEAGEPSEIDEGDPWGTEHAAVGSPVASSTPLDMAQGVVQPDVMPVPLVDGEEGLFDRRDHVVADIDTQIEQFLFGGARGSCRALYLGFEELGLGEAEAS